MPFVKGDPRINRKGRPKSFDALRTLALEIAHEEVTGKDGQPIIINGHIATATEIVLRQWLQSKDTRLVLAFFEYAYGKPPTKQENLNVNMNDLTDEQLERIAAGEDIASVLKRG